MKESIWKISGFLPYVIVVFLNAFTDLGHKIIIQNTVFKIYDGETQIILTAIVNALILLPFILLFSPSGFIGDRYPKNLVLRLSAGVAVLITLLITLCYYTGQFKLAFGLTFLLAVQSAIYSPAKYGYIKELVGNRYLAMGNGIVQAVTTVSILSGILIYSIFFEKYLEGAVFHSSPEILKHIAPIGWMLVLGSLIEFVLAYRLPNTHIEKEQRFDFKIYIKLGYLKGNLKRLNKNRIIMISIIGLALFWGISQVVLSSFPEYAKTSLKITNTVLVQGMMAIAGIGIIIGSIIAGKMSKHYIEVGSVPMGAIGITASLFALPYISDPELHMFNFFLFGVSSGLFIVPLNALIQYHSEEHELGIILAGNNFIQNIVMFSFLMMTVAFALMGLKSIGLFYIMFALSLAGTVYLLRNIPQALIQFLIFSITSTRYRLSVFGAENIPESGSVLLLGNHISWIDWIVVQMATRRRIRFVMDKTIYEKWYLRGFFDLFGAVPISPRAMKKARMEVERMLKDGEAVCLFPEGTISRNGKLGEFKRGFEIMAKDTDAVIVPFYLDGLWGDIFSRSPEKFRGIKIHRRRDLTIHFGERMNSNSTANEVKKAIVALSSIHLWNI